MTEERAKDECMKVEAYWQGRIGSLLFGMNTRVELNSAWRNNKAVDKYLM